MQFLDAFRRQPITRKLTIVALALLGPLCVLGFFMDLSFRYDILICRTELAGTRYLRPAFRLLHSVAAHHSARLAEEADLVVQAPDIGRQYDSPEARRREVEDALAALERTTEEVAPTLMSSPSFLPGDSERMDPALVRGAWERVLREDTPEAYDTLTGTLLEAMSAVSDCANLALDPALDSHSLATATALTLPSTCRLLGRLERTALQLAAKDMLGLPTHSPLMMKKRDLVMRRIGLLLDGQLAATLRSSNRALMEDPKFYEPSPSLQHNYPPALRAFERNVRAAAGTMLAVADGRERPAPAALLVRRAHESLARLASVGLDELDGLIERRMASYQGWRMAGAGLGGLTALLALTLLITTSRHLSKSVSSGLDYVRRVASGDYSAEVDDSTFGRDLAEYTAGVRRMVATLKRQLGSLDGVLRNMTVPCLVVDREERLTFVNQPYLDLFERRRPAQEYIGKTIKDFFYLGREGQTILGRAMQENKPVRGLEMSMKTRSGRRLTIRFDLSPLHDLDGRLIGGFAVVVDLTEKHEQQEEIERLAAFPRENPSPVLATDAAGDIIYMNPAAGRALEALGMAPADLLPANHADIVQAVLTTRTSRLNLEAPAGGRVYTWAYHPVSGQEQVYLYALDITERKRMEEQLAHDALHDGLTGLPNRTLFLDRVKQALNRARREDGRRFAVFFLDLDRFKNINDSLGHAAGDDLLIQFGKRLSELMRSEDTVARLGGDEFTVLLDNLPAPGRAMVMAERIHDILAVPFHVEDHELFVSASVGIVVGPDGADGPDELLRNADTAMYRAKAAGRAQSSLFDEAMHGEARERLTLEMDMKRGLDNGEFVPFFQPIVDLRTGRLDGFEALARWRHPERGLVSPALFIPLAEETGLIAPLGRTMLDAALQHAAAWRMALGPGHPLTMSVNLSVQQMIRSDILDEVREALDRHGCPPQTLKIELTESGIMDNAATARRLLEGLSDLGVGLSIDDFGTGYSSLSHLSRFPFDYLKIDQSFVRSMLESRHDLEIVRTIITLAQSLDKRIIAEGIEEEGQLQALRSAGCQYGQGYLFARPAPAEEAQSHALRRETWFPL